jgi:hypothetical protein
LLSGGEIMDRILLIIKDKILSTIEDRLQYEISLLGQTDTESLSKGTFDYYIGRIDALKMVKDLIKEEINV